MDASLLNGFGRAAGQAIVDAVVRAAERGVDAVVDHFFSRAIGYVVAAILVAIGAVFALIGLVEALKSAHLPSAAAYGLSAAGALAGGYAVIRSLRNNQKDD